MAARPRRTHRWRDHRPRPPGVGVVRARPVRPASSRLARAARSSRRRRWLARPAAAGRARPALPAAAPAAYSDPSSVTAENARSAAGPCPRFTATNRSASASRPGSVPSATTPDPARRAVAKHRPAEQRADPHGAPARECLDLASLCEDAVAQRVLRPTHRVQARRAEPPERTSEPVGDLVTEHAPVERQRRDRCRDGGVQQSFEADRRAPRRLPLEDRGPHRGLHAHEPHHDLVACPEPHALLRQGRRAPCACPTAAGCVGRSRPATPSRAERRPRRRTRRWSCGGSAAARPPLPPDEARGRDAHEHPRARVQGGGQRPRGLRARAERVEHVEGRRSPAPSPPPCRERATRSPRRR